MVFVIGAARNIRRRDDRFNKIHVDNIALNKHFNEHIEAPGVNIGRPILHRNILECSEFSTGMLHGLGVHAYMSLILHVGSTCNLFL